MNPMFPDLPDCDKHPATVGMDFHFDQNGISEEVLRNYLSRAQNCNVFNDPEITEEDLRMLFTTGAKMWSRAYTPWKMTGAEYKNFDWMRETMAAVHEADPDIVFENCIFETAYRSVEEIAIPPETFRAFGLEPEERNFSYEAMCFPDGRFLGWWGPDTSVPDITQLETQLWFYHRACLFIDLGFECIHFGQMMLVCKDDVGFVIFDRIIRMIRDYARDHARRGWILVNAHIYDDRVGNTDRLICDFHISPTRGLPPIGSVAHKPTEYAQEIELLAGHFDAIYLDSVGGVTPSGWRTSSLPYLIELDNAGGFDENEWLDAPCWPKQTEWYKGGWWGYDEIGWFAIQPGDYRRKWLRYAWHWIKNIDGFGYCQMPGHRPAVGYAGPNGELCNEVQYLAHRVGDVETMAQIWLEDHAEWERSRKQGTEK